MQCVLDDYLSNQTHPPSGAFRPERLLRIGDELVASPCGHLLGEISAPALARKTGDVGELFWACGACASSLDSLRSQFPYQAGHGSAQGIRLSIKTLAVEERKREPAAKSRILLGGTVCGVLVRTNIFYLSLMAGQFCAGCPIPRPQAWVPEAET